MAQAELLHSGNRRVAEVSATVLTQFANHLAVRLAIERDFLTEEFGERFGATEQMLLVYRELVQSCAPPGCRQRRANKRRGGDRSTVRPGCQGRVVGRPSRSEAKPRHRPEKPRSPRSNRFSGRRYRNLTNTSFDLIVDRITLNEARLEFAGNARKLAILARESSETGVPNWRPQGDLNPCYRRERAVS